ncbi:MAG: VanZ family protein [Ekhidna sp.]|uniref:VanZ family protein n=1 Tax=Ekhidna sp. TaxID=2608089 RepID=UPI0032EACF10
MKNHRSIIWFIPALTIALGIFLLSTILSVPVQVKDVGYFDKIEHFFAYFVLVIAFLVAFKKTNTISLQASVLLVLGASIYGFLLELAQYSLFPDRYFEWIDAGANVLGVIVGFTLFKLLVRE